MTINDSEWLSYNNHFRATWHETLAAQVGMTTVNLRNLKVPLAQEPTEREMALLVCMMGQCMTHGQRLVQEVAVLDYYAQYLSRQLSWKKVHLRPVLMRKDQMCLDFLSAEQDPDWLEGSMDRMY